MDLIPARNSNLYNASPEARSVISHFTETVKIVKSNAVDSDPTNNFPPDPALYEGGIRKAITSSTRPGSGAVATAAYGTAKLSEEYATDRVDALSNATEAGAGLTASSFNYYVDYSPRGGELNVWLTKKPYVGQNASIYVMLLDNFGEMSGAPIEVSLTNDGTASKRSYLAKWKSGDFFVAFGKNGKPIGNPEILIQKGTDGKPKVASAAYAAVNGATPVIADILNGRAKYDMGTGANGYTGMYFGYFTYDEAWPDPSCVGAVNTTTNTHNPKMDAAAFDDTVGYYVDLLSAANNWSASWGPIEFYIRQITATTFADGFQSDDFAPSENVTYNATATGTIGSGNKRNGYAYLLAPSGGIAQPKCFRENGQFVYKVNVPSILYEDMVLVDYYVEYKHNATQVSILPDKFGPYMYVEGESLVRRASDGMDLPVSFVIPKFKITTALTFTLQSTGDASTFTFSGDAFPDYSKFDQSRKVLADIQILDADDNYDNTAAESAGDPTDYRRYRYNDDTEGEYLWKDPMIEQHSNIDYSDPNYMRDHGGPITRSTASADESTAVEYTAVNTSTSGGGAFDEDTGE